ncbi:MAG: 4Fe-4S binding protein [Deltaproteobacteria bacterium]|nr:4Fe-4S binding protein [Deltaproteobacteria bacterium]
MADAKAGQTPLGNPNSTEPHAGPVPPPRPDWIPHVVPPPGDETGPEAPKVLAGTPVRKKLFVLPGVCVGCKLCEMACSLTHEGVINPYLARIKVNQIREEGVAEPTICRHCTPAPCEQACPTKALSPSPDMPGVVICDREKCNQCHSCVDACPFGAIQIGPLGEILKCDMCGGNPACAAVCQDRPEFHPPHWRGGKLSALAFIEPQDSNRVKHLLRLQRRGPEKSEEG